MEVTSQSGTLKTSQLQIVTSKRKKTGVPNQYVQRSIIRLFTESDFNLTTLRQVAQIAGTTEPVAYGVLQAHMRELAQGRAA